MSATAFETYKGSDPDLAVTMIEEAEMDLRSAIALLRRASKLLRQHDYPAFTWGQLDQYTIPTIEAFFERTSQPGNLLEILDDICTES